MNRRSAPAVPARTKTGGSATEFGLIQVKSRGRTADMLQTMLLGKEFTMSTRNLALLLAAAVALGGCASAGGGSSAPYAGPHNHTRDAKQGPAPSSTALPAAPSTRKSLRPAS